MAKTEEAQTADEAVDSPDDAGVSDSWKDRLTAFLSRWSKLHLAAAATIAVLLIVSGIWFMTRKEMASPAEVLQEVLRLLDEGQNLEYRELAQYLDSQEYRDPAFAGATEFILGIVAFREAEGLDAVGRGQQYQRVERLLRTAASEGLDAEASRKREWAYAFGTSLHHKGSATEALRHLNEAVKTYESGKIDASMQLTDIYLDLKTPEALEKVLKLSATVIEIEGLTQLQRDRISLQRAQAYLALGRHLDAEQALGQVSEATFRNHGTTVFRVQMLMAKKKYLEAMDLLDPVTKNIGLEQTFPRQASYLLGVCANQLGENYLDAAVIHYEQTADKYEEAHEGLAANLRAADLLRKAKPPRNEQALNRYRRALRQVRRPEDFRNRWLSLEEFRQLILDAWYEWVETRAFQEAITLSHDMVPLLPADQAHRLVARAHQRWAEHIENELRQAGSTERKQRDMELRERWQLSGKAFDDLADTLRTSSEYPEALWVSAEHYRKGHDFPNALRQLTRFINTQPKKLLPLAFVRKGEVLMDLGRLDEALDDFRRVVTNYPTDSASFEAQYLVGKCQLERNHLDPKHLEKAEEAWRGILASEQLTPAANEWRMSLFSLGRLQYHVAAMLKSRAEAPDVQKQTAEPQQWLAEAFTCWDEAIRRLEEFLKRYPTASQASEARYLLAKALKHSAELPRQKLEDAETDNARRELRHTMKTMLEQSIGEFRILQKDLLLKDETDQLGSFGQHALRDCHFEIAHAYYDLGRYKKAIVSYGSASNRYPQIPQVLLAYIQMENCYKRLGKLDEAHSMLQQAKVIHEHLPPEVFEPHLTNMDKAAWKRWLKWAARLHGSAGSAKVAAP